MATDLTKNEESKWEESKSDIGKSKQPQPKVEDEKPPHVHDCKSMKKSRCKKSKAERTEPKQTTLRTKKDKSKLTKS